MSKGVLTIKAERPVFRYRTFSHSVTLPLGAGEENIDAVYGHGILEMTVQLADKGAEESSRKVPVRQNQHIGPS